MKNRVFPTVYPQDSQLPENYRFMTIPGMFFDSSNDREGEKTPTENRHVTAV
jgi:hypothetical protein